MPRGIYSRSKTEPSPLPKPSEPLSLTAIVDNLLAREQFLTEQLSGMEQVEIELEKVRQAIRALQHGTTDLREVA